MGVLMLVVYSKNNCQACESAKGLLKSKGIEFVVKNVDDDWSAFDFIVSQNLRSFPQIFDSQGNLYVQGGFKGLQEMLK
jgi:glutaredoxin